MTQLPQLTCALCGNEIQTLHEAFRASGEFLPSDDPLVRYCNAPMHWTCYEQWTERPRFARHHVLAWQKANRRNPFWWTVYLDDDVYVSVNPERPVEEASVRLFATGGDIRVPLPRWGEWLERPEAVSAALHSVEEAALRKILPRLKERFPDDHAVVHAIDPAEKRTLRGRR